MSVVKYFFILIFALSLSGCATWMTKPTKIQRVNIQFTTVNHVNTNILGSSSPIAITVYYLEYPNQFEQANYQTLTNSNIQGLIATHHYLFWPGQIQTKKLTLPKAVKALGIIASYRNLLNKHWKLYLLNIRNKAIIPIKIGTHGIKEMR